MSITRIGIFLAKQVFQLHGVDRLKGVVLRTGTGAARADFPELFPPTQPVSGESAAG